jgi:hypothetical protein
LRGSLKVPDVIDHEAAAHVSASGELADAACIQRL